jgi:hypothetical protein
MLHTSLATLYKKVNDLSVPYRTWPGLIKLFPARESLVSDIPAEDGKIASLFYSVQPLRNTVPRPKLPSASIGKEELSLFTQCS